jgi:hypothetical protein
VDVYEGRDHTDERSGAQECELYVLTFSYLLSSCFAQREQRRQRCATVVRKRERARGGMHEALTSARFFSSSRLRGSSSL